MNVTRLQQSSISYR